MKTRDAEMVLVVDDDPNILHAISARLHHVGYDVCTAQDAMAAMSAIEESRPKVAIMDINLPGVSGLELSKKLARNGRMPQTIFLTASKDPRLRKEAMQFDSTFFLEKPFNATELLECLDQAFEAAQ